MKIQENRENHQASKVSKKFIIWEIQGYIELSNYIRTIRKL